MTKAIAIGDHTPLANWPQNALVYGLTTKADIATQKGFYYGTIRSHHVQGHPADAGGKRSQAWPSGAGF